MKQQLLKEEYEKKKLQEEYERRKTIEESERRKTIAKKIEKEALAKKKYEEEQKRLAYERQYMEEGDSSEMPYDVEELIEKFIKVQVNETVDDEFEDHREQVFKELLEIRKENEQDINKHFKTKGYKAINARALMEGIEYTEANRKYIKSVRNGDIYK